jgi:hypothetical protein
MDLLVIASIVASVLLVLLLLALGSWMWRLFRENEEPVAGGLLGRQALGRTRDELPDK